MYVIGNLSCDVLWFGETGIVKARDRITNKTNRYVWQSQWISEVHDIEKIVQLGTKITEENISMLEKRFKPYTNFKKIDYQASDEMDWKLSRCCDEPISNWLCTGCQEHQ